MPPFSRVPMICHRTLVRRHLARRPLAAAAAAPGGSPSRSFLPLSYRPLSSSSSGNGDVAPKCREELDRQYHLRNAVPEWEQFFSLYPQLSLDTRAAYPHAQGVPYGASYRETVDVFPASTFQGSYPLNKPTPSVSLMGATEPPLTSSDLAPVHVFLHGGYWHHPHFIGGNHSFVARPFVDAGASVVVVDYGLLPEVTMDTLVHNVRSSLAWVYDHAEEWGGDRDRIFVSGHSAGGHLVAMAALTDWRQFRPSLPRDLVKGGVAVSGLYDLAPIAQCYLNDSLRLDDGQVERNSPLSLLPLLAAGADAPSSLLPPLILCHGGGETDEYHRQQRVFEEALRRIGADSKVVDAPGSHHFQVLLDLCDPESALCRAALGQMGLEASDSNDGDGGGVAIDGGGGAGASVGSGAMDDDEGEGEGGEEWECLWAYDGWLQIPALVEAKLKAAGVRASVKLADFDRPLEEQLRHTRVLLPSMTSCGSRELAGATRLSLIMQPGVGCDTIDFAAAAAAEVPVAHVPDANAAATSEFAILQILSLARRFDLSLDHFRSGDWIQGRGAPLPMGLQLARSKIGVVGGGRIGSRVAAVCATLGMEVQVLGSSDSAETLEDLLQTCDVVTLHCPLNDATRGLISAHSLAAMRPRALLVNSARAGVVDEDAVLDALQTGHLRGYATDVFIEEPAGPSSHPLYTHPNVLATPHVAVSVPDVMETVASACAGNIAAARAGRWGDLSGHLPA